MMNSLEFALQVACIAHSGQKDKSGKAYVFHPVYVASKFEDETLQIVSILHDVVEDSNVTLDFLRKYFTEEIVSAIDAITHRKGEENKDYIERCSSNDIASKVKYVDVNHNLSRIHKIIDAETRKRLTEKYCNFLNVLERMGNCYHESK